MVSYKILEYSKTEAVSNFETVWLTNRVMPFLTYCVIQSVQLKVEPALSICEPAHTTCINSTFCITYSILEQVLGMTSFNSQVCWTSGE